MIEIVNPLLYPLAVLAGGITLVLGVRFAQLPNIVVLPTAAVVATAGASWLKSRQVDTFDLDHPELVSQLQAVNDSAKLLAQQAKALQLEATKLLTDTSQIELLATVQYTCDRAVELPDKIDRMVKRFHSGDSLLSVKDLQQQLVGVQNKILSSSGVARENLNQLAKSIQCNIQLAQQGQDVRMAQVVNLATSIQDAAGILQKLQNKLRLDDLSDSTQTLELQQFCTQLSNLQENVDLLASKSA